MSFDESKFLLKNSKEMLEIIDDFYRKSLLDKEISIVLKLKIKHFLEDIKSSFDYAAFKIYKSYCLDHIKDKPEDHERVVCFPVHFSEKKFNTFIKNIFPELENANPKIVQLIKKVQPFEEKEEWYKTFNSLVNKNKHRYLTPQTKNEHTIIKTFDEKGLIRSQFPHGGIVIKNSKNVKVDGMDWDQDKQLPIPSDSRGYLATTWVSFVFTELNKPVIPTLIEIQMQAEKLINELEKITFTRPKIEA